MTDTDTPEPGAGGQTGAAPSRRALIGWGGAGLALGAVAAGGAVALAKDDDGA
ncbi:deferrochelatase/peroxidase EfeB, partial [Streptomyces sp. SID5998]|nr:deferrochelatase/peroxidase EfeB [Streptomyces sp. SID5998]